MSGLDLGGACSPGPALDGSRRSNLEPELCGQEGALAVSGGRPSVAEALQHMPVLFVCSLSPSPQRD